MGIWNLDSSRFLIVKNRMVCKWYGFQKGSKIQKPDHLKSGQMVAIVSKTIWNPDKDVQILNGWDYSYRKSYGPFENRTILKSDLQKSRFWMVGFQILAVFLPWWNLLSGQHSLSLLFNTGSVGLKQEKVIIKICNTVSTAIRKALWMVWCCEC